MFSILQRYSFESNSQPFLTGIIIFVVVFYLTKILIWKQFTTSGYKSCAISLLFSILQRYSFESNSQPLSMTSVNFFGCFLSYKDTHLKAIHNTEWAVSLSFMLFSILQRYSFESNSQPSGLLVRSFLCCFLSYKDTHLKAIHNSSVTGLPLYMVVFYLTKILIWKQFTTTIWNGWSNWGLFSILQRYSFESNSQLGVGSDFSVNRCFLSYKDTHLKAIHNNLIVINPLIKVVFYLTKILIWKQFTTLRTLQ